MRVLVVDDDVKISAYVAKGLREAGFAVDMVANGTDALAVVRTTPFDVAVVDVMLPGIDGFSVASQLRTSGCATPILMLTARGRAEDVLRGFEAGADDYLPKPFDLAILVARVNALVRRHARHRRAEPFSFAGRVVDFDAQNLRVGERTFHLTLMETNLLRYLIEREGQIVSRKSILEDVWNLREDTDTRAIDHFIARLRKYIEDEPSRPRHVLTARGVGYRFVAGTAASPV